jgi:hypothetical protein
VLLNAERQGNNLGVGGLIENFWAKKDKETNDEERENTAENRIQNFWQDVGEAVESRRQQAEELRRHQEAWDNSPSSEYPGMSNREVLAGLQRIVGNLPYYADQAVKKGLIKEEDKIKFEEYMRRELWLKEQERNGNTKSAEYIAAKRDQDQANKDHPTFKPAAVDTLNTANSFGRSITTEVQSQTNLAQGTARIESGTDAFNNASTTAPVTSSVAKTMDEKSSPVATMLPAFNSASNVALPVTPAAAPSIIPKADVIVSSNAGFNMNAGAI